MHSAPSLVVMWLCRTRSKTQAEAHTDRPPCHAFCQRCHLRMPVHVTATKPEVLGDPTSTYRHGPNSLIGEGAIWTGAILFATRSRVRVSQRPSRWTFSEPATSSPAAACAVASCAVVSGVDKGGLLPPLRPRWTSLASNSRSSRSQVQIGRGGVEVGGQFHEVRRHVTRRERRLSPGLAPIPFSWMPSDSWVGVGAGASRHGLPGDFRTAPTS